MRPSDQETFVDERLACRDLICFAPGNWGPPLMPVHQIMLRLAPFLNVLYVEPPLSHFRSIKDVYQRLPWRRFDIPKRIRKNLWVYSLPVGLPFKRMVRFINRLNQAYVARLVAKQAAKLGMREPILWLTWPTHADVIGKFNESMVVYHVADELLEVPWGRRSVVEKMEDDILRSADLVIVSSRPTYDARKNKAKRIILVPNGVDFDHFSNASRDRTEPPPDIACIPKPIIGFSGAIDRRFDFALLRKLAERYRHCSFVLIGPLHVNLSRVVDMANVYYLGMKSIEEVPLYLAAFDICLIPYLLNEYTMGLSPLKLLEYLSLGKPVVSTAIPACVDYDELVYVAKSHAEFMELMEEALCESDPSLRDLRVKSARQNTWEDRVGTISRALADVLEGV